MRRASTATACWNDAAARRWREHGIRRSASSTSCPAPSRSASSATSGRNVFPVLTPLAGRPRPPVPVHLATSALAGRRAARSLRRGARQFAAVKVPKVLPRWCRCAARRPRRFVLARGRDRRATSTCSSPARASRRGRLPRHPQQPTSSSTRTRPRISCTTIQEELRRRGSARRCAWSSTPMPTLGLRWRAHDGAPALELDDRRRLRGRRAARHSPT